MTNQIQDSQTTRQPTEKGKPQTRQIKGKTSKGPRQTTEKGKPETRQIKGETSKGPRQPKNN